MRCDDGDIFLLLLLMMMITIIMISSAEVTARQTIHPIYHTASMDPECIAVQ